jgi:hypothetical protein
MMPDDALARRLRALADEEAQQALDGAARARVEARALRQLARASRVWPLAYGLALAASVGLAYVAWSSRQDGMSAAGARPTTAPSQAPAPRTSLPTAASPPQPCAGQAAWRVEAGGGSVLDLGTRALVVAGPFARITGGLLATCDTTLELSAGAVQVHARALEGHALRIATPLGQVQVKGTVFGVALSDDGRELAVQVAEGVVEVDTGTPTQVPAGLHFSARRSEGALQLQTRALTRAEALALRTALGLVQPVPRERPSLPPPDAAEPAGQARAWHAGSVDAPHVSPERGTSMTDDGRPMAKPRIVRERKER